MVRINTLEVHVSPFTIEQGERPGLHPR